MKCSKCGAELTKDAKFCSYCGEEIETEINFKEKNSNAHIIGEISQIDSLDKKTKISLANSIKHKCAEFWNKLTLYGKVTTIALSLFILMSLIGFLTGKSLAGIIAGLSVVLTVVALLMKKQIIKTSKKWIPIFMLFLAVVLVVPYVGAFGISNDGAERFKWADIVLGDMLPEPHIKLGRVVSNSDDYMSIYIYKCNQDKYDNYINACKDKGFSLDIDETEYSFYAFNETGYKLSVYHYESSEQMGITLEAPEKFETVEWPEKGLAKLIPTPKSSKGKIEKDNKKCFKVYVAETSLNELKDYVKLCADEGFNLDVKDNEKSYSARNSVGNKLLIEYQGNNVMLVSVYEPEYKVSIEVECVENWIFSKYDVEIYIDDDYEDTLLHGTTETYPITLTKGTYTIKFVSAEDDELTGKVKINITRDEEFKFKISCSSLGIDVKTIAGTTSQEDKKNKEDKKADTSDTTKITVTMSEDELKGLEKTDAENKLKSMGFTEFEYNTLDTEDSNLNNKIGAVEIKSWVFGDGDFSKGDTYESDAIVVLWSYKYKEPEKPDPVFYSTNDYETAKKGNSGVFSYKNKSGSYDVYWIINFDEGYVYWFTEGNGESTCDKVKIVSGNLNDRIIVTWHDGGEEWSWKLHFKYVNSPVTLIVNDHNGFATEFTTTDLDKALALRNTKTIKEY